MGDTIEIDVEEIKENLREIKEVLDKVSTLQQLDHIMTVEHDKILVRGNGVPSLQDTVRSLSTSVASLVLEAKNDRLSRQTQTITDMKVCWDERQNVLNLTNTVNEWVANVKEERTKRNEIDELERKRKKEEMGRWKWAFIGLAFTIVPTFLWQAIVFWIDIAPHIKEVNP